MFSKTALAVAATAASMAFAQAVTFNDVTLNQCATVSVTYTAPAGSYYVALVPANDACSGAPFSEYHDVSSGSVDATVNIASGTQVQVYVTDGTNEFWSGVMTVGDGDASCLGASSSASESSSSTSASSSASVASATTAPSAYVAPANNVANSVNHTPSSASSDNSDTGLDTPANDASNGASSATVSLTLIGGALFAAAALF